MAHHNFRDKWETAHFLGTEKGMYVPGSGYYRGWGTTVGSDTVGGAAVQGWAPGALYIDTDAAAGAMLWINEGTAAAASWKAMVALSTANVWALIQTFTLGIAVTTADLLTVGGIIIPQEVVVPCPLIPLPAAGATRALFFAQTVGWTVTGLVVEMSKVEATASIVATFCKVTGNNVAVAATTPLHTGTFDMTSGVTAGTPTVASLTATGADLVLAATNKIGVNFTGGDTLLDTGCGVAFIKMKRS